MCEPTLMIAKLLCDLCGAIRSALLGYWLTSAGMSPPISKFIFDKPINNEHFGKVERVLRALYFSWGNILQDRYVGSIERSCCHSFFLNFLDHFKERFG